MREAEGERPSRTKFQRDRKATPKITMLVAIVAHTKALSGSSWFQTSFCPAMIPSLFGFGSQRKSNC